MPAVAPLSFLLHYPANRLRHLEPPYQAIEVDSQLGNPRCRLADS